MTQAEKHYSLEIGETHRALEDSKCRFQSCPIGNLAADAMLDYYRNELKIPVKAALFNAGDIRKGIERGAVRYDSVLDAFPFPNSTRAFHIAGSDIEHAIKYSLWKAMTSPDHPFGGFLQPPGLEVVVVAPNDAQERMNLVSPNDLKIRIQLVDPETGSKAPLQPDTQYLLAATDFLQEGGDGFESLSRTSGIEFVDEETPAQIVARFFKNKWKLLTTQKRVFESRIKL